MNSLPCPPAQWPRFSALLDAAMELSDAERHGWLDSLAGEDAAIRPLLVRVLGNSAAVSTGQFLRTQDAGLSQPAFMAGAVFGPYRLESLLGEGGMGEVWRASRHDDGPRREVALKLPHAELLGGTLRQRFARERDMLAALSHPHIAQLYDAGSAAEGHPYLALELVQGEPITEVCRSTGASLDRRIELVIQILESLSYAHQRLIVHRDIKPSNVLVTPEGSVKLLDFGIAKMLGAEPASDLTLTRPQARLATPAYAAPEQLDGGAITVATDIYAVGVLLFELCTGHRPFVRAPLDADAAAAPLASQRADAAAAGLADKPRLARRLRGDLDAVIARAITLNPAGRYASAESFADDLRRYRQGLPVQARRIGLGARAKKFARRNKLAVGLAAFLLLALAGGTAGVAWQARRAEDQALRAQAQAARANAIKDYLINLFAGSDPRTGNSIVGMSAKALLDLGADRAGAAFGRDPATELEMQKTLGRIYESLSDGKRAEAAWSRHLDLSRQLYGAADPRVIDASLGLVQDETTFQDEDRARPLLAALREPILATYGKDSLQWAQYLSAHALSLRDAHGRRDEAIADEQAAIAIYARHFPDDPNYGQSWWDLSGYQYDAEDYASSLASLEKARAIKVAQHRFDPMEELNYRDDLAPRLWAVGRPEETDAVLALAQAQAERQVGKHSLWYQDVVVKRARYANLTGNREYGDRLFAGLLALGQDGTSRGVAMAVPFNWSGCLVREGRAKEAIPIVLPILEALRQHPRDETDVRDAERILGDAYDLLGRTEQARPLLRAARDAAIKFGTPDGIVNLSQRERWGRFLMDHGEPAAATAELTEVLKNTHGAPTAIAASAKAALGLIALNAGNLPEADASSAQAMALIASAPRSYDVRVRVRIWLARVRILQATGNISKALSLAADALKAAQIYDAPESPQLAQASDLYRSLNKAPSR
jgi:serine/threonine-protein kinase